MTLESIRPITDPVTELRATCQERGGLAFFPTKDWNEYRLGDCTIHLLLLHINCLNYISESLTSLVNLY